MRNFCSLSSDRPARIRKNCTNQLNLGRVHYGKDPKDLSQTAKSHIRLNPTHSYTVFGVEGLAPKTIYYKVDSADAHGANDGVISPINTFTTP